MQLIASRRGRTGRDVNNGALELAIRSSVGPVHELGDSLCPVIRRQACALWREIQIRPHYLRCAFRSPDIAVTVAALPSTPIRFELFLQSLQATDVHGLLRKAGVAGITLKPVNQLVANGLTGTFYVRRAFRKAVRTDHDCLYTRHRIIVSFNALGARGTRELDRAARPSSILGQRLCPAIELLKASDSRRVPRDNSPLSSAFASLRIPRRIHDG